MKSRQEQFYYAHPRNRFWRLMAGICSVCDQAEGKEVSPAAVPPDFVPDVIADASCLRGLPQSVEQKRDLLLSHGIALWDVIDSCDIHGSSDSSIRNVVPVDLSLILPHTDLRAVFVNGGTAWRLAGRYLLPGLQDLGYPDLPFTRLPSTSPANAAWSLSRLWEEWRSVADVLVRAEEESRESRR